MTPDQMSLQLALSHEDPDLDVGAFAQCLNNTTNSYKYLFLLALLDRIGHVQSQTQANTPIVVSLTDIALDMAALAWYPIRHFRLSFGGQDPLPQLLFALDDKILTRRQGRDVLTHVRHELPKHLDVDDLAKTLLRYVPFLLLRPFFAKQVKDKDDGSIESRIRVLSQAYMDSKTPALYALVGESNRPSDLNLHLNVRWQSLVLRWHRVIRSWVLYEWAKYLQAKNPAMPNILGKLLPPAERQTAQFKKAKDKLWQPLLEEQGLTCPYSNNRVDPRTFDLDHFLPWSYVGHDLPWNLVPTVPSVNSAKGAKLPKQTYIPELTVRQHKVLTFAHRHCSNKEWLLLTDSYCQELRLDQAGLLDIERLGSAYVNALIPQLSLGRQLGFESEWSFARDFSTIK